MKTLVVMSQKGGSGKTTLTVHLAVCAANNGLKTAVLDIDPQASAFDWNQSRPPAGRLEFAKSMAGQLAGYLATARKAKLDLVLVDTAPHAASECAIAAQLADYIVIPCRPATFDLRAIFASVQIARAAGKPFAVVINSAPRGKLAEETRAFLQANSVPVMDLTLYQRAAYAHAVIDGRAVHEYEPNGKAASEIDELYSYVVEEQLKLEGVAA
jgi:chromosome partitioning protein